MEQHSETGSARTARSRWLDLDGPVHYLDYGGPEDGPVVVCVHGLGGSAVNWSALAPLLTDRCRVYAIDLPGHGRTWAYGRRTGVAANRAVLHRFVRQVVGRPVILMGNSMGGMISLLQAAAEPADVTGLILVSPAVPLVVTRPDPLVTAMFAAYGTPVLGRSLLAARRRLVPSDKLVDMTLDLCTVDSSRVPAEVVQEHYEVARTGPGTAKPTATSSAPPAPSWRPWPTSGAAATGRRCAASPPRCSCCTASGTGWSPSPRRAPRPGPTR